ncbi:hypothetical protein Ddc_14267 [Ditylenchus destructor]|nr:hypothetical protein Ddc_14267 [Ditylenchus destructor]
MPIQKNSISKEELSASEGQCVTLVVRQIKVRNDATGKEEDKAAHAKVKAAAEDGARCSQAKGKKVKAMTSPPVYSTALQQALSLLPHISPMEMKVLISAAKAQWAPLFSNEILADSFRYLSRTTLIEKICPVNSRYFQICVNSVPNVHNISKICVVCDDEKKFRDDEKKPTLYLGVMYDYCTDHGKGRYRSAVHKAALDDFPHSAPFLRFDIVSIGTHFSASRICEFFRSHCESFSQCKLLIMEGSCFKSNYILAESDVQLCGLLVDVFKNCKNVTISDQNYYVHPNVCHIFQDDEKLSAEDKSLRNKWIGNMVAYLAHYLFNTRNAYLKIHIIHESLAVLLVKKVCEIFKSMTMDSEFCVSFIYKPDKHSTLRDRIFTTVNETTHQRLSLFECLNELPKQVLIADLLDPDLLDSDYYIPPVYSARTNQPEEFRLWCAKIKPNEVLSNMNGISTLQIEECASLYTEYYDHWDWI